MLMTLDDNSRLPLPKIGLLVEGAKAELKRVGIDTEGKRSDEILNMAREERNRLVKKPSGPNASVPCD
jgi:hypothetical protein